jgi:hypothetical protein
MLLNTKQTSCHFAIIESGDEGGEIDNTVHGLIDDANKPWSLTAILSPVDGITVECFDVFYAVAGDATPSFIQ